MLRLLPVSLFTREWIEISIFLFCCRCPVVSLFTREWIEMLQVEPKSKVWLRLPLYEGVDWNHHGDYLHIFDDSLPLYEGVDWNYAIPRFGLFPCCVSLFTREWIEIRAAYVVRALRDCLPLYEGVDWNSDNK